MHEHGNADRGALRTYLVASLPGWLAVAVVTWLLYTRGTLPLWGAVAIAGALIATDLALFPRRRSYYTSQSAHAKLIGAEATAVSDLAPSGFVRINGELWQATTIRPEQTIREGKKVRVHDMRGLELIVDRSEGNGGARSGAAGP